MKLTILHNDIDLTLKMGDLSGQEKPVDLSLGPIYIGYYKPIKNFYVELIPSSNDTLKVQYFNGLQFVDVENLEDHTFGLSESGLVRFEETKGKETIINGKKLYWLKVTTEEEAEILIKGINLVLSNDKDLSFVPSIMSYLPNGFLSWIAFHQEATSQVVQYIRNSGKSVRKIVSSSDIVLKIKQVDQFDLLEIEEFKNASKYYALHLIFDYISKVDGDPFAQKSIRYYEKYLENLNDKLISIDQNDNGITDGEDVAVQFTRLRRE